MLFNSLTFWGFFTLFLLLYFSTFGRTRLLITLVSSYFFYAYWDYRFLILIILLTCINFYCGRKISKTSDVSIKKKYLFLSVFLCLAILGLFKYFNFFIDSFSNFLLLTGFNWNLKNLNIILPIGISFYTFQAMSYTIDLYKNNLEEEKSYLKFSVFIAFFPQLVAGPIIRAKDFLPQLKQDKPISYSNFKYGLIFILWGLVLKVVLADNLAISVERLFSNPFYKNGLYSLICVFFYGFQIYGDFAGYSLIAIGLARILGFVFPTNFNKPYFSRSFSEFWKRWHISLSSWLRDYLYIPLGGNRGSRLKVFRNLMITMILGGLWHGASWAFLFWGFLHGIYLIFEKILTGRLEAFPMILKNILSWIIVMSLVFFAWIYFRAETFNDATRILLNIFDINNYSLASIERKILVAKGFLIIFFVFFVEAVSFKIGFNELFCKKKSLHLIVPVVCILLILIFGMFRNNAFIYFQF